jgi:hypothetical protein
MKKFNLENYPIELMIQLVFTMYNVARFVNDDNFSERYSVFENHEGLLRFTQTKPTSEYKKVLTLLTIYREQFKNLRIKDTPAEPLTKSDVAYQLLHIHGLNKRGELKPILQLICGIDIQINETILTTKLTQLEADAVRNLPEGIDKDREKAIFADLKKAIDDFFRDKDNTLYIIYQLTPENLTGSPPSKIKQLNTLKCLMANITDKLETATVDDESIEFETEITIPISIERQKEQTDKSYITKLTIKQIRDKRKKEILYNLTLDNTFADFGITMKAPLELTQSVTNITATLLNAQYLNEKLKEINKKLGTV